MYKITIQISLSEFEKQRTLANFKQYLENGEAEIVNETRDSITVRTYLDLPSWAFFAYLSRACLTVDSDSVTFKYNSYRSDLLIVAVLLIIYYQERTLLLLIPGLFVICFGLIAGRKRYKKMLVNIVFLEDNKSLNS